MPRLQRGGRQLIDQLLADLADIDQLAGLDRKEVLFHPRLAADNLIEILDVVARMRRRLRDDLEPALERHERNGTTRGLHDRVAELERLVAQIASAPRGSHRNHP